MHRTAKAIVGLAAAGMIGGIAAAGASATSATRTHAPAKVTAFESAAARAKGTSYVGSTGTGGVSIVVSRDLRQVRGVLFAYRALCTDNTHLHDFDVYNSIPISGKRKFKDSYDTGPQNAGTGITVQATGSISGVLNKAATRIKGTAQFALTVVNGTTSYKCDTGPVAFTATD